MRPYSLGALDVAPARRRAAAVARRRRGTGHCGCRARRVGGAGEDAADDHLQELDAAGQQLVRAVNVALATAEAVR